MQGYAKYKTIRCALHIHSTISDGGQTVEEIIADAEADGVDILFFNDHPNPQNRNSQRDGRMGNVLVSHGMEVKTRDGDHLLIFGMRDRVATRLLETPKALDLLAKLGVPVIVAHPQGRPNKFFFSRRYQWKDWQHNGFHGLEVWSYMHDWIEECSPLKLPEMCREPDRFITGPDRDVLANWDHVAQLRKVSGIGGLDSHGRTLPLGLGRLFNWAKDGILPYRQNFAAFATYAQIPRAGGGDRDDITNTVNALQDARCWVCHDSLGCGRDFNFTAGLNGEIFPLGSEIEYREGIELAAETPQEARIVLLKNGENVAQTEGKTLRFTPDSPAAYRVEAYLADRPWIFSNHIYLRD